MAAGTTIAVIAVTLLLGLSGYFSFSQYQQVAPIQQENENLRQKVSSLESEKSQLEQQRNELIEYSSSLSKSLEESQAKELQDSSRIDELTQDVNYYRRQADLAGYQEEALYQKYTNSLSPPYTLIQERNVIWVFEDSKGNQYNWEMPIDTYRNVIESPEPQDTKYLTTDNGQQFTVRDYTKFVDSSSFAQVIDDLYNNAGSEYQFLYEVWYVTSQLTTYSTDIQDDPRWALETFTESGGDCEDLTILIASMLKASPHTDNWTIQMVYFDADNPDGARNMNHVALFVKTDDFSTYVESTAKVDGLNQWDAVTGWYFEV